MVSVKGGASILDIKPRYIEFDQISDLIVDCKCMSEVVELINTIQERHNVDITVL